MSDISSLAEMEKRDRRSIARSIRDKALMEKYILRSVYFIPDNFRNIICLTIILFIFSVLVSCSFKTARTARRYQRPPSCISILNILKHRSIDLVSVGIFLRYKFGSLLGWD